MNARRQPNVQLDELKKLPMRAVAEVKVENLKQQKPYIPRYAWGFYEAVEAAETADIDDNE